ncbi:related to COP9 signalosome complex subunit 3 [Cephalotrichum gorgonifer]|uniref:Related to COP9 signalosome complex subunit 3 n=1 Tax=Cephalotrichum gorgonifer TaxID=2041049 RepID=A0AAE8SRD4_9PEZI|nr:related to COP9 signalosome complex subunit 3 [Cephalotrichum gorgonifer]
MDDCISGLKAFPPDSGFPKTDRLYHDSLVAHVSSLDGLIRKHRSIILAKAEHILSNLQADLHTASYVSVIDAVLRTEPKTLLPHHTFLNQIIECLVLFDQRQVRYVGTSFRSIMEYVLLNKVYSPAVSVDAVATALLRLDPSGSVFTSTHSVFANLVYSTGCIDEARPILEKPAIFYPDPTSQPKLLCDELLAPVAYITKYTGLTADLTTSSVLEYDMMRALIFIQERRWAPALDALERCINFPTDEVAVSSIMVQAFYKWVLVSLILHGRIIGLPGSPSAATTLAYETSGEPYVRLDTYFAEEDASGLLEHKRQHKSTFAADRNLGLVDEVLVSFQKWQIVRLGDLYSKISISEIRQLSQSAVTGKSLETDGEVLQLVRAMIEAKVLDGRLQSPGDGQPEYLEFLQASEGALTEAEFARQVAAATADLDVVSAVFKTTNAGLARNQEYVKYMRQEKRRREKDPEGRMHDLGVDFENQIEDEDLMLGVGPSEG